MEIQISLSQQKKKRGRPPKKKKLRPLKQQSAPNSEKKVKEVEEKGGEKEKKEFDPKTTAHEIYVKALKQAGFEVAADPEKMGKSIIVSMGDEKEFTDAISEKLQEKFKTVERIFTEMGGSVDFIPGKGQKTIKYWGNISIQGVSYVLDFTYNVGQAYTKISRE